MCDVCLMIYDKRTTKHLKCGIEHEDPYKDEKVNMIERTMDSIFRVSAQKGSDYEYIKKKKFWKMSDEERSEF